MRASSLAFVAVLLLAVSGIEGLIVALDPSAAVCDDEGCSDCGECGDCIRCAQATVLPDVAPAVPSELQPPVDVDPALATGLAPSEGAPRELLIVPRA